MTTNMGYSTPITLQKIIKIGRKKVRIYHDNFEYFQPNDHICGDCSVRAVAKALGKTWYTVYDKLCEIGRKMQLMPAEREVVDKYLTDEGFVWVPIKVSRGMKRPKVSEFAKQNTNPAVLSLSGHYSSSRDGKYYDIWDCGNYSIYGYWIKK